MEGGSRELYYVDEKISLINIGRGDYDEKLLKKKKSLQNEIERIRRGGFIVIINIDSSISYRTNRSDINLGEDIAKVYGGGGHMKASGSPIDDSVIRMLIGELFYMEKYENER